MNRLLAVLCLLPLAAAAQPKTVSDDRDWAAQAAALHDATEAEWIVRTGDVDNLGFGWPEDFDPFCGRTTLAHEYPWQPKPGDVAGLDRILLSSKFKGREGDGYSGNYDKKKSKPVALELQTKTLKGATVHDAWLQLFIDDFQAPSMGSRFQVKLNGKRFAEGEQLLNAIDQTGPVGKLVTLPVPEEFFADLTGKPKLTVLIDEVNGAGDGWAIDFVRLLVNRKRENTCTGTVKGVVVVKGTGEPIAGATVTVGGGVSAKTNAEGAFVLAGVPTGFAVVTGSASGYADGRATADVGRGEDGAEVSVELSPGKALVFDKKEIKIGEAFSLNNILFDVGKAVVKKESKPELDKVVAFLKQNPTTEIELSGHTSSEGDAAMNRSLSYRRVQACKDYVTKKGVDAGRIVTVGYGPDRPVASNETEDGRKLNRRVELRVVKD